MMNSRSRLIVVVVIMLITLGLIGAYTGKEGSVVIFLVRLVGGLTIITFFMYIIMGGVPILLNKQCPKCKKLDTFEQVEEIIDGKEKHKFFRRCKSCGYVKTSK